MATSKSSSHLPNARELVGGPEDGAWVDYVHFGPLIRLPRPFPTEGIKVTHEFTLESVSKQIPVILYRYNGITEKYEYGGYE